MQTNPRATPPPCAALLFVAKTDAVGDVVELVFDPGSREIETTYFGPVGGAFPTDRTGSTNVKLAGSGHSR